VFEADGRAVVVTVRSYDPKQPSPKVASIYPPEYADETSAMIHNYSFFVPALTPETADKLARDLYKRMISE
jgi:hypothetical protein